MKLKLFSYFLFITGCIIFFLYAHFPGEATAKHIEQTLLRINPEFKLQINEVNLAFPPGITAESIQVSYIDNPIAKLDKFKSTLNMTTLFGNTVTASFKTNAFNGVMSGVVRASKVKPRQIDTKIDLNNLKLDDIFLEKFMSGCSISGTVNGKVTAGLKAGQIKNSFAEVKFENLVLQFSKALFSIETYSFSTGKVKFVMPDKNIIRIEEFILKGKQVDIQSSGEIRVSKEFSKSNLKIKARFVLYPMFFMNAGDSMPIAISKSGSENTIINLSIGGTIQNPVIAKSSGA